VSPNADTSQLLLQALIGIAWFIIIIIIIIIIMIIIIIIIVETSKSLI